MAANLTLIRKRAGDLTLLPARAGGLVLQHRRPGDLTLVSPGGTGPAPPSDVTLQVNLPPPAVKISIEYDNAVWRGVSQASCAAWERANGVGRAVCATHGETGHLRRELCNTVNDGRPLNADLCAPFLRSATERLELCAHHQSGRPLNADLYAPWVQLTPMRRPQCQPWQEGEQASPEPICLTWVDLLRTARPGICAPIISAKAMPLSRCGDYRDALRTRHHYCWSWQDGVLRTGWGGPIIIPPEPPQPPEQPCAAPLPANLVLVMDRDTHILILAECDPNKPPNPPGQIVVPVRRVYYMLNEARLYRVSDNQEIPVINASAAIDASSWVWSLSADIPVDAQALVADDGSGPVELELVINTHKWRFMAENLRSNRAFGSRSLTVSGRGPAAALAEPYVEAVTYDNAAQARTAVQLMEDALTVNGVQLPWSIDATEITDWLIPAGAWSHTGSHISAINAIASAIDALVQADPLQQIIKIRPRYPALPWEWASSVTPDIILPEDAVVQEGVEWIKSPSHNAVYVSGTHQGVLGRCLVEGTAGDDYAAMVTHDLITHADAVRQRGSAVLGVTGRRQKVVLSMPIGGDTNLPVIHPGTFIDYGPLGIGLSRGVRVDARRPAFRQSVDLEVYLGR